MRYMFTNGTSSDWIREREVERSALYIGPPQLLLSLSGGGPRLISVLRVAAWSGCLPQIHNIHKKILRHTWLEMI
jgi:hypothetical protein